MLWSSTAHLQHNVQTTIITTTKISHNATADVILLWVLGGGVYDILQTNGDLNWCCNVARMTRLGSGPLYNCILTLPIQKAHIYIHTHDKEIFWSQVYKSSSTVFINKKTWTSHYQSALSHGCNVTIYIFKLVYTGRQYLCSKTRHA